MSEPSNSPGIHVRPATREDLEGIREIVSLTLFPGELLTEMMQPYFDGDPEQKWLIAMAEAGIAGVAFFTTEPLTDGTWNLKAIGVLPERQRVGMGRALLAAVESDLRRAGARLLLVDTSSSPDQAPARAFYESEGYECAATIADFWSDGDDKVTFVKRL